MTEWLGDALALARDGRRAVLVTVAAVRGSAPREIGARMLVTDAETVGTIGGGQLEYRCAEIACDALRQPGTARLRRFPLGADCGQCCGGVVDVLFEPLDGSAAWLAAAGRLRSEGTPCALLARFDGNGLAHAVVTASGVVAGDWAAWPDAATLALARRSLSERRTMCNRLASGIVLVEPLAHSDFVIAVFGAGHVGAATVGVLATLDASIRWIDSRREFLPARVPCNVQTLWSDAPAREVAALPPGAYCLVMTHSHPLDLEICGRVLERGDLAYLGLIGSRSKRRRFEQRLAAAGYTRLERLTCPIGIAGVTGKAPSEIAIATAAELLKLRGERQAAAAAPIADLGPFAGRRA
ncbi:MAG: xanthine dehydrogenase accessory protein XdhC [Gammaproteobacteria bacterium]|nr:xanthine dehydrogenase accessory protein XdhC [Gammaproteobacteria bacterium]MDH4255995.1 xanthine dehydrogenase accessory protein XdhC [Gammaproteobacteria bacterium]MDH5309248.1 xanthine dehydrogenase accessory protein XdhC [Gammaproteobacteria bacterium]